MNAKLFPKEAKIVVSLLQKHEMFRGPKFLRHILNKTPFPTKKKKNPPTINMKSWLFRGFRLLLITKKELEQFCWMSESNYYFKQMSCVRDVLTGNRFRNKLLHAHGKALLYPSHTAKHLMSDVMTGGKSVQSSTLSNSWSSASCSKES